MGVDHGQIIPSGSKFLVCAGVQPGVFGRRCRAALPAKSLIAKIPKMPLTSKERTESGREPAESRFAASGGEETAALQAEPLDAPLADEEIVPSDRGL